MIWKNDPGRVIVLLLTTRPEVYSRAFADSLEQAGYEVCRAPQDPGIRPAIAVSWGMRRMDDLTIACNATRVPVLILENGYISRPTRWLVDDRPKVGPFVQVSWGRINNVPDYQPSDLRLAEVLQASGLEVRPTRADNDGYILVCGQVPDDAQHKLGPTALNDWYGDTILRTAKAMGRNRVLYRPHPMNLTFKPDRRLLKRPHGIIIDYQNPKEVTLAESMRGACVMVTYNSNAGVEAMIEGLPVICDPKAHYHAWCNGDAERRSKYLARLANMQWTLEEIAAGKPLPVVRKHFVIEHNRMFPQPARQLS